MSISIEYLYCERASPLSHRATGFMCIFYFLSLFYFIWAKFYAGIEGLSRWHFSSLQKWWCKITLCSFVGWNPRTNRLVRAIFMTFKVFWAVDLYLQNCHDTGAWKIPTSLCLSFLFHTFSSFKCSHLKPFGTICFTADMFSSLFLSPVWAR